MEAALDNLTGMPSTHGRAPVPPPPRKEAPVVTAEIPDRVRRLAASAQAPHALTTGGIRERFGEPARVRPSAGQVWRATWADVSRLVLLVEAKERYWRVAPVSVEPTGEDHDTLVLSPESTVFGLEVTVWAGLARSIPTGTLSRIVDTWPVEITSWCGDTSAGSIGDPPSGARRGRPGSEPWDGGAMVRVALTDDMDVLAAAPLVPTQQTAQVDLRAAARAVGLRAVVDALGTSQPETMQILSGKRPTTQAQAQALAPLLGFSVDDIMAASGSLPFDLAVELEQPWWRSTWQALARYFQGSETSARISVGFGVFGMAYRQTGETAPDWRGRIGQWLATQPGLQGRDVR